MMKNASRFSLLGWLAFFSLFILPDIVLAQSPAVNPAVDLNGLRVQFVSGNGTTLLDALWRLILIVLRLAGILAFIFVLYGGFLYLTAGGDAAQVGKGKSAIINAIIGIFIITTSYVLVRFVVSQAGSLDQQQANQTTVFTSGAPVAAQSAAPSPNFAGGTGATQFAGRPSPTQFAGATPRVTVQSDAPAVITQRSPSPGVVQSAAPIANVQLSPSPVVVQSAGTFIDQACPSPGAVSAGRPVPGSCPSPVIVQSPGPIALRQSPGWFRFAGLYWYRFAGPAERPQYAGARRAPDRAGSPSPVVRQSPAPVVRVQPPGWFYYAWSQIPHYYSDSGSQ